MNDMRIPPGLLNPQAPSVDSREQRQPDIEAARAFDRLFENARREPQREMPRDTPREAVRAPERAPVRTPDRTEAQRTQAETGAPRSTAPHQRAQDRRTQEQQMLDAKQDSRASQNAAIDQVRAPRGDRSSATAAEQTAQNVDGTTPQAALAQATPPAAEGPAQLSFDPLLATTAQPQSSAQLLNELQAASAALLQAAQALATPATAAADAAGDAAAAAKTGPVLKQIDPAATAPTDDSTQTGKDAVAEELGPVALGAASDAQARAGVRDRLLEDFERRFERSLAAVASSGREGFTPGTPQALASLVAGPSAQQPIYSSAHATIATPLNHPAFAQDLSQRVMLFAGQRVQNAELAVTPADLGPIKVSIEMRGQEATLAFSAQHATTRAAIEDALPRLREMFADQGLQLAHAHVGDQRRQDNGRYGSNGSQSNREAGRLERPSGIGAGGTGGLPNAYGVRGVGLIDIHV
jgi:flagellar hook-length control protein FliK